MLNLNLNEKRIVALYIIIMLLSGFIFFKLYAISISDYTKVFPALTGQYTRKLNVAERRGFIFDRNNNIIAGFDDAFNCIVDPSKISKDSDISKIPEEALQKISEGKPFIIKINVNINNEFMSSFQVYKRYESLNPPALHITGYVDKSGSGVGGIEEVYNDFLKYQTSAKIDAVYDSDALFQSFGGSPVKIIDYNSYNKKTGMALTLDINLQKKAEEIADKYLSKGAIIIASAQTGEILACVSRPVYSLENISDFIESENGEFINRAFSSFTPGSVFKTIVAAAALEENADYYNKEYDCKGEIDAGGKIFKCHKRTGHGVLTMCEAYAQSCNTYFMNLALETGYDKIYAAAKKLGIGEKIFLDGFSVKCGNIPDIKNPPPAFIANTAIGQGELLITPLEAARIFCCIANGGVMPELSLLKSFIFDNKISDMRNYASKKVLSDYTVRCLLEMTQACVDRGTGIAAKPDYKTAGGKTSSAESGQYLYTEDGEKVQVVHSWFSGYYPAKTPENQFDLKQNIYAISIIAEGGVTDNVRATAVFKEICDYLFEADY